MKNLRHQLKSSSGFMLLDVLLALSCLVIITMYLLPTLNHVMNHEDHMERSLIAEENLSRLLIESLDQTSDHEIKLSIQGYTYHFAVEHHANKKYGCLSWITYRTVQESMCGYVPIYTEF